MDVLWGMDFAYRKERQQELVQQRVGGGAGGGTAQAAGSGTGDSRAFSWEQAL